jgi:hypothetical protein
MSDIQRYVVIAVEGLVEPDGNGPWVSFADHERATKKAWREGYDEGIRVAGSDRP